MAGSLGQLPPVTEQVRLQGGRAAKEVRLIEEAMDELAAIGKVYDQAIAIWLIAGGDRQAVLRIERWMCEEHHMPGISAGWPVPVESARRQETTVSVIRRMTRLAVEHGAVNLTQGFTDEDALREAQKLSFYATGESADTDLRFAFCRGLAALDDAGRRLESLA